MLRTTISKIKKACTIVFIPKIIQGNTSSAQRNITKRTYEALSRARKSTDSSNDEEYDKKMRIIEKCFAPKTPEHEEHGTDSLESHEDRLKFASQDLSDKCQTAMSKTHEGDSVKDSDDKAVEIKCITLEEVRVHSTTSKEAEEKLTQKVENIDEISIVEAAPKIEGFNIPPKILGQEIETLKFSQHNNANSNTGRQIDYDELAKRCLGSPISEIDDILLRELRKLSEKEPSTTANPIPLNLVRSYCVENYYGDVLYKTKKASANDTNSEDGREEILKADRIQPLHLDKTFLCVTDDITKDFTETGFIRSFSNFDSTSAVDEPANLVEMPAIINPYDSPSFPFYEYNNKEYIKEDPEPVIIETINETNLNEATTVDKEIASEDAEEKLAGTVDMGALGVPEETSYNEDPAKNSEILEETKPLYVSRTDQPTDWYPQPHMQSNLSQQEHESTIPNTAISGTFPTPTKANQRSSGRQPNTAISAHQEFNEFHGITFSEAVFDPECTNSKPQPIEPCVVESPLVQSLMFEAKIDISETQYENTYQYIYPISHILFETQLKPFEVGRSVPETQPEHNAVVRNTEKLSVATEALPLEKKDVPLSEMLRRVRRRNRMESCQNYVVKANENVSMNKKPCIPPLETPKRKDVLSPPSCQPKPKSDSKCAEPCQPKKDPCAKFSPAIFGAILRNAFYVLCNDVQILKCYTTPIIDVRRSFATKALLTDEVIDSVHRLGNTLKSNNAEKCLESNMDYAREFEPWTPIPSWPIPKKEKKRPFVCPKDGCKMIPPPDFHAPCKENPCRGFPKRTFSATTYVPLRMTS